MEQLTQRLQETEALLEEYRRYFQQFGTPADQEIVTVSPAMRSLLDSVDQVARFDSTVVLLGESGAGKELVARRLHQGSHRAGKPFIKVNCGAIPEPLLESELFGYEKGAFTGAQAGGKPGLFELAHEGTIFLDEVGDLPLPLQVKLLHVLQDRQLVRVGGTRSRSIDVRIIAATHRDLKAMVAAGTFRADLYYRLEVISFHIPPLRQRLEDIPSLALHFLDRFNRKYKLTRRVKPELLDALQAYTWPGNVRELENLVERLVVTAQAAEISPADLPESIRGLVAQRLAVAAVPGETGDVAAAVQAMAAGGLTLKQMVARFEAAVLRAAVSQYGSTRKAAQVLGIDQSTIVRKLHGDSAAR